MQLTDGRTTCQAQDDWDRAVTATAWVGLTSQPNSALKNINQVRPYWVVSSLRLKGSGAEVLQDGRDCEQS